LVTASGRRTDDLDHRPGGQGDLYPEKKTRLRRELASLEGARAFLER